MGAGLSTGLVELGQVAAHELENLGCLAMASAAALVDELSQGIAGRPAQAGPHQPALDPENDAAEILDPLFRRDVGADPAGGFAGALQETLQGAPPLPGVDVIGPTRDASDEGFGHEGIVRDGRWPCGPQRLQKQDGRTQRVSKLAEGFARRRHPF
jgi:hypothetical protein